MRNPFHDRTLLDARKSFTPNPIPGLHIVANLAVAPEKLFRFEPFKDFIGREILENHLHDVGGVFHNFPNGGFTAVICLTESHLSIHTWPESNYLTFDVFLSNYLKDNRAITQKLYENVKAYFQATVLFEQIIER